MQNQTIPATNPLGYEKIPTLIRKFAVPSVISMLVNSIYNIVDQIFIGQGVGYLGNAATNVAFPLVSLTLAISLMIGNGCAANTSLLLGQGRKEEASEGFGSGLLLSFICGLLLAGVSALFLPQMMVLFGATDAILQYALDYTSITLIGIPFIMVTLTLNSVIRADGSPKYSMYSILSGAILNTILDPIFIFGLGLGVRGAAMATVIGQIFGFVLSGLYLFRFKHIDFHWSKVRLRFRYVKVIANLGMASLITQLSGVLVQIVLNNSLRYYGGLSVYGSEVPLSVMGIVMKVNMIVISIILGIGIGAQPIIGFNYGAEKYKRVKHALKKVLIYTCTVSFVGWLCFLIFPQAIISVFGSEGERYTHFAVLAFRVFLMGVFAAGFQIPMSGYFQSVGKPTKASLLSLTRQVFFLIPLILIFPLIWGLEGILYAGPVADIGAALLTYVLFHKEQNMLNEKIETGQYNE
ncbi:MAG: MATE family efflux transporter [Anaerofustis sp.]